MGEKKTLHWIYHCQTLYVAMISSHQWVEKTGLSNRATEVCVYHTGQDQKRCLCKKDSEASMITQKSLEQERIT